MIILIVGLILKRNLMVCRVRNRIKIMILMISWVDLVNFVEMLFFLNNLFYGVFFVVD